jgi:predicted nucleotidyltransferase
MSQQELLKKVIQVLEDAGIEYMVSGSLVSSLQGEPRSTHDIDVVVAVQRSMAHALARSFPPPGTDKTNVCPAKNSLF